MDLENFYPGASSEENRQCYEKYCNEMIQSVLLFPDQFEKAELMKVLRSTLANFSDADTEDRERACFVCEKVMDTLGIRSSEGMINGWLYG